MDAAEVARIVEAFTEATNRHDVEQMLELVSDDVIFEGTTPPDGLRIEGDKSALRLRYVFDRDRPQGGHV